jgi:hypothetical protein
VKICEGPRRGSSDDGDRNDFGRIKSLLSGASFTSSNINSEMTESGTSNIIQIKLVTVGSLNNDNLSGTGDITHNGTSFDRGGADDGDVTNSTYNEAAAQYRMAITALARAVICRGKPTGWRDGRFFTGTRRSNGVIVTFEFNDGKTDDYATNDPEYVMLEVLN